MADAALSVGHGDNPITSVTSAIRTFAGGVQIPVIVKLDPLALETKLHDITGSTQDPPKDASVAVSGTDFTVVPGTPGQGIDETTIANGLIDQLANADTPSQLQVGGKFITVQPNVTDSDAQAAIDSANKMSTDVTLTYGGKTWTIDAATIRSWIIFGDRSDGTYGPVINPALVLNYVTHADQGRQRRSRRAQDHLREPPADRSDGRTGRPRPRRRQHALRPSRPTWTTWARAARTRAPPWRSSWM